jgi:uncharacterized protein (DUF1778 family)
MADTIPVRIDSMDRQLLESVAQFKGLKLSTWMRAGAIEASRRVLEQRSTQLGIDPEAS